MPALPGAISKVPYGEPTWLTQGFKSPYYKESHYVFQKAVREFVDTYILPDALACEESGKRASKDVLDRLA